MNTKKCLLAPVLLVALTLGFPPLALAQNRTVNAGTATQAGPQTIASSQSVSPAGAGFVQPPSSLPYYPPYPYIMSPAGSYLTGASDVINAQGQFLINKRQSEIIKEQAEQAKLDTKRKAIEEWQYEKSIEPTLSELQAKAVNEGYQQARGSPPDAQIWNGQALNAILRNIQQNESPTSRKPSIPVDPETVSHVNVTDGTNYGNLGQFSKNPKLDWPFALQAPDFKEDRDGIAKLMADAMQQAQEGKSADFATIDSLQKAIERLQAQLRGQIEEMTPNDYTRGKRFLNDLEKSARALGRPNAADLVSGKWQPEASTVDQLVASLTKRGLRFAPAREGSETAYSALYQALRAYDTRASQLVARPSPR
jgi:hypothetical protein